MAIWSIRFSDNDIWAILQGRKISTRFPIKPQPEHAHCVYGFDDESKTFEFMCGSNEGGVFLDWYQNIKPPFLEGDVLWVREPWETYRTKDGKEIYIHKTMDENTKILEEVGGSIIKWRPSVHMPRAETRIFLRVTGMNAERLQDMDEISVFEEGAEKLILCNHQYQVYWAESEETEPCYNVDRCHDCPVNFSHQELYGRRVWDEQLKPKDREIYGWDANPWVWVYKFERMQEPPEGFFTDRQAGKYADNPTLAPGA